MWAPAEPTLAVETDLADYYEYAVRVFDHSKEGKLVAAIELVSPANKDRPEHRGQFVAKCAAMLKQNVSVVLIDLVTVRNANLYMELLSWLGQPVAPVNGELPSIYAAACRWRLRDESHWLETWNHHLAVGSPLPVLPLWLSDTLAVPLVLEASYQQTCIDLRLP